MSLSVLFTFRFLSSVAAITAHVYKTRQGLSMGMSEKGPTAQDPSSVTRAAAVLGAAAQTQTLQCPASALHTSKEGESKIMMSMTPTGCRLLCFPTSESV